MKEIIEIKYDMEVEFIARPNRYLAEVMIEGKTEFAHVHDPGRLKELLYSGNKVLIRKAENKNRKTAWDVVAASSGDEMVIVNSAYHRNISEKIVKESSINPLGIFENVKAEVKYGNSRIDYLAIQNGEKIWIEVKGCTLVKDGVATFPDAPTERGARHLEELTEIVKSGEKAAVYILVLRAAKEFVPNIETDKKFYENFYKALNAGVKIFPIQLQYREGKIYYEKILNIREKEL